MTTRGKLEFRTQISYSEEFKKDIVREIESCKLSVLQASREYQVSCTSLYKWLHKYSTFVKKGSRVVVEKKSEKKRSQELRKRNAELEQIIGQKQLRIDFLEKLIELASEDLKINIKKNFGSK